MFLKVSKFVRKFKQLAVFGAVGALLLACEPSSNVSGTSVDLSQPVKVAFLAPSNSGNANFKAIGQSLENAARLAVSELGATGDIQLMFYPTDFSEVSAVAQAAKARADGATLIIGPLSGFNAVAVAAADPNMPVWTFSNNSDIVSANTYILGTSFDVIAERVVKYVRSTGVKNLGILATNDASGKVGLAASLAAAKSNGMKVVYSAQYPLSVPDIQAQAPSIAASLKSTGAQALMLTDTPTGGLGFMANALAEQGYSSTDATYMGLSRWDDVAGFLGKAKLEGGYFAAPDINASQSFDNRYAAAYGAKPHGIGGLGYDGVVAAITLIRDAKRTGDTTPFSTNDIVGTSVNGSMGAFKFSREQYVVRALTVMQVKGGKAVVVSPASGSF